MLIKRFVNTVFNSNTYLLYKLEEETAWVIDPGSSSNQIITWLVDNEKYLSGILLTHTHFDHIYGLNDLREKCPRAKLYASTLAKDGMISEKLNGSLYKEIPFTINRPEYTVLKDNDQISLWNDISMNVIETPGHDRDCLSFQIGKNLFTGDALIPGIKIHTKSKYSDKKLAKNSINRIFELFDDDIMIYPGHEKNSLLGNIKGPYLISLD